jgi:hypothetical protein
MRLRLANDYLICKLNCLFLQPKTVMGYSTEKRIVDSNNLFIVFYLHRQLPYGFIVSSHVEIVFIFTVSLLCGCEFTVPNISTELYLVCRSPILTQRPNIVKCVTDILKSRLIAKLVRKRQW